MAREELQKNDRVITPRDEVGFVVSMTSDGFVHGEYAQPLSPANAYFTLSHALLVRWKPNSPRPKPYRAPGVVMGGGKA